MTDRYHGYTPTGRAATFNNPRASMPSSIGYTSLYAGDMHVLPASTRHPVTTPRGYTVSTTSSGVPTTTRTYAVTQDPRVRHSVAQDHGRNRRSTLDSGGRPPVIVTTTQKDRPGTASTHSSSTHRAASPVRHSQRASEGQFFTQPATSARNRTSIPTYSTNSFETDDYSRSRDRTDSFAARDAEAYRNSRPSVTYPSDPRHSTAAVDYGDEGYQYTNAGELARYDLDHTKPRKSSRHRESVDRGYYRPNISYNADQRSLNVNTSADLSRNYSSNTSRPYEGTGRGGPPPSTRGFDKINRSFDSANDVPPAAPAPPNPTVVARLGEATPSSSTASESREGRRNRPVSLYQDVRVPHSSHHDEYYRSREDERNVRELRDRERESERARDAPHFHDESVQTRGFGIRTGPLEPEPEVRREREVRREEPRRRSDEDIAPRSSRESDIERDGRYRGRGNAIEDRREPRRESRDGRRGSDEEQGRDRSRLRDKITSGVGIAATAVGLKSAVKDDAPETEPRRRRSPSTVDERRAEVDTSDKPRAAEKERPADRPRDRDYDRDYDKESQESRDAKARNRREAEARLNGEAIPSAGSESDEGKRAPRTHRQSIGFNPNDASDINKLRQQLNTMNVNEKELEPSREPAVIETRRARSPSRSRSRSVSDPRDSHSRLRSEDDSRGRMVVASPESDQKMVRVVSPPREKGDERPLRGILKQPKSKFPEETNFIREGAAPHKEDKKAKEVPPGARWTKISRKVVNPEALTVGKERFEIRDEFVIVLRVLSKEEIQAYAAATQVLRGKQYFVHCPSSHSVTNLVIERRRARGGADEDDKKEEKKDDKKDDDRDRDEDARRRRRHRRHHDDDDDSDYARERDGDRRRRNKKDEDDEPYDRRSTRDLENYHHRNNRERERERAAEV